MGSLGQQLIALILLSSTLFLAARSNLNVRQINFYCDLAKLFY